MFWLGDGLAPQGEGFGVVFNQRLDLRQRPAAAAMLSGIAADSLQH
jgi:hypothetical protein